MTRYFFDVDDGRRRVRDEVGVELIDLQVARMEAARLLQTLAELRRIEGRSGTTYVTVRNAQGETVHAASIFHDRDLL